MFANDLAKSLGSRVYNVAGGPGLAAEYVVLPNYRRVDSDSDPDVEDNPGTKRKHEYLPLRPNEIRLLVLNPGLPHEPINCYLEHYSVNSAKPFQAVSYVWGSATGSSFIQVDGCPFKVTANLKAFLASFRSNANSSTLWIDAVCINQNNILERNAQIRLMKRVYEGADAILIWLGPQTPYTKSAIGCMEDLYQHFWLPRLAREGSAEKAIASITAEDMPEVLGTSFDVPLEAWTGIEDLLERPWWSRIWVYQEATAPAKKDSTVRCGAHSILFRKVLTVNKIVRHLAFVEGGLSQFQKHSSRAGLCMEVYSELRREYQEKGVSDYLRMADLLPTFRGFAATNPRDKLFALIPTSLDGAELLDVDYGLSVRNVYTQAALAFIRSHRNLNILGHCTKPENGSQLALPSWVPDWTAKSTPVHFFKRGRGSQGDRRCDPNVQAVVDHSEGFEIGKLYNAAGDSVSDVRVDESLRKLFCQGFEFDAVDAVSPSSNETYEWRTVAGAWTQWLQKISFSLSPRRGSYVSGDSTARALSHTLVADSTRVGIDVACRDCVADLSPEQDVSLSASNGRAGPKDDLFTRRRGGAGAGVTGAHPATFCRRLVLTRKRYLGLTADHVRRGDVVAILMGGQLPFVLRKIGAHYILIGEAYVHGIMDGEAIAAHEASGGFTKEFEIR